MQVLSFPWDKNTTDGNTSKSLDYARVMDIWPNLFYVRKNLNNIDDNTSVFRIGHVREGLHRRFFDFNESIVITMQGIEDQIGATILSAIDSNNYKYNMQINTDVSFIDDTCPVAINGIGSFDLNLTDANTSNLKLITVTTTIDANGDDTYGANEDQVVLRTYAANIGEVDYNKRRY